MPPHPRVSEEITSRRIPVPYALEHLDELRNRGVDGAWSAPALESIESKSPGTFARTLGPAAPPSGSWKALVILVDFSDKVSQVAATSFDALLFGTGSGTLRDYYRAVSYNSVDIVTVHLPGTIGWRRAPGTYAYYVNSSNGLGAYPQNAQKLTEDAVTAADPLVDFSQYDNNGDGYVDALFIVHAGPGAEYTGSANDIWSHAWSLSASKLVDGVRVYRYSMEPEYWAAPGDMTMGVYAHELGHAAFGLPDLYDRDNSSEGLGNWSLMASGSWNGLNGMGGSPSLPDAWSHAQMGYLPVTNIATNTIAQQFHAVENTAEAYRIWTDGTPGTTQYFLAENRQRTGYDSYLPNGGLLIYHVDGAITTQNDREWYPGHTSASHYLVALEQADGNWELDRGMNRGNSGDSYPGSTGTTGWTFGSTPDSRDYAEGNTNVGIRNISASAATMTADVEVSLSGTALTVLSPNGGEQWETGSTQTIRWEFLGTSGNVQIEFSTDNGTSWSMIATAPTSSPAPPGETVDAAEHGAPGTGAILTANPGSGAALTSTPGIPGSYVWLVPMASSSECRVRVSSIATPALTDQSNRVFALKAPGGDTWSIQFNYDATAVTGDGGNAGAVFIPTLNEFWTSRWGSTLLHRWHPDGTLIGSFTVPGVTGIRGMVFDGISVVASTTSNTLNVINPVTRTLSSSLTSPVAARYVAYDPAADGGEGGFWVGNFTTSPTLITRDGATIRSIPYASLGVTSIYGAAYDTVSVGGPFLWFWGQSNGAGYPQWIVQVNATTGLPTGVKHDVITDVGAGTSGGLAGGLFVTSGIVPNTATIGGLLQGTPNRLFGYTLRLLASPFAVKVFLEGPYDPASHLMKTALKTSGALAAHHGAIPIPGTAVDNITIELRNAATTAASTVRRFLPAWLLADGTIRDFADTGKVHFVLDVAPGDYYIVVSHRNHLAAMSATTVHVGSTSLLYDFTTGLTKYYGNEAKNLGSGIFGLYAGDANASGGINATDRILPWNQRNQTGYLDSDLDLSGGVSAGDRLFPWNNRNRTTQVPN